MKALVVYYSRTGRTKQIAEELTKNLTADIEEIIDTQKRSGLLGYLRSGYQARKRKLTVIKPCSKDPSHYDIVLVGTPMWYFKMATPVRTYLHQQKNLLPTVAFFCTYGGTKLEPTFAAMEDLCGKKPVSTLGVSTMQLIRGTYSEALNRFINELTKKE